MPEFPTIASEVREKYDDAIKNRGNPKQAALVSVCDWLKTEFSFFTFNDTKEIVFYDGEEGYYVSGGETFIVGKVQSVLEQADLKEISSRYFADEVVGCIKRSTYSQRSEFTERKELICLRNGVLDIETGEFSAHSPEFKFLSRLDVEFLPDASCPRIKKFLSEVLRQEDIAVLEEVAGYLLLRDSRFQVAFMFLGEGNNGKSVLLNVLRKMLGEKNVSAISLQEIEANRFALTRLYQKHANFFADLNDAALKGTGKFKILTGGDAIDAEAKFGGYISFYSFAKLLFSANRLPYSDDKTGAFFRRWIFFGFSKCFEGKENRNLIGDLTDAAELSGFLNVALAGLKRLLKQNQFSNSKSTTEKREDYIRQSDSVAAFALDCLEQSIESESPKSKLWSEYLAYCGRQKITNQSERVFFTQLKKQWSMEETRPKIGELRVQCIRGVKLKEQNMAGQGCQPSDAPKEAENSQNGQTCQGCQPSSTLTSYEEIEEKEVGKKPDMSDIPDAMLVLFLKDFPAWKGADGRVWGPFKADQEVKLPAAEAVWAIKAGVAKSIEGD